MKNVIGMISSNYSSGLLEEIAERRPIAAIPFGGRYRFLDFPLSSMVNSGIRTVGIITPFHYRAILDHLGAGKEWLLDRKAGGLFILPGPSRPVPGMPHKFMLRDMGYNIEFLAKTTADHVIISGCNTIFNLDFNEVVAFHQQQGGDVTLIYKEMLPSDTEGESVWLEIEEETGRVDGFSGGESLHLQPGQPGKCFMDILVIERKGLMEKIEAYQAGKPDDLFELIRRDREGLSIFAFPARGYMRRINSISGYFQTSMALLNPEIRAELFMGPNRIHTKIKDNPPTRYGRSAEVQNSLISSGCRIEGRVEGSILAREVFIGQGAEVRNSIIMQECSIEPGAVLDGVILDKFVQIRDHTVLQGRGAPTVVKKQAVV